MAYNYGSQGDDVSTDRAARGTAQAAPAPVAEDAEIRKALHDAATSLETISRLSGIDPYMLEMVDVRIYAAARAKVARDAQAAAAHMQRLFLGQEQEATQ